MRQMLTEIQSGAYAEKWAKEHQAGLPWFKAERELLKNHPIEQVGQRLRARMPFLEPAATPSEEPAKSR